MKLRTLHVLIATAVLSALLDGCQTTRTVTKRSQILSLHNDARVTVLTKDSVLYNLGRVFLRDSTVYATGVARKNGNSEPFDGEIALSKIQYLQSTQLDYWKTVLAMGAIGFVGATARSYLNESSGGFAVATSSYWYDPRYQGGGGGGGGGSCPFVYSWDGNKYVLESEAYGTALGKALEMRTVSVMRSLRSDGGEVRVLLTNERPETHYYNAVSMASVETDQSALVVADPAGGLWPVIRLQPPLRAIDGDARDVRAEIEKQDDFYWESPLSDISPTSSFQDAIEIDFPQAGSGKVGTLVVRAISTRMFDVVLHKVDEIVGNDYLTFVRAIEEDPELVQELKDWTNQSRLMVEIWDGKAWRLIDSMPLESTAVPFVRGVRLPGLDGEVMKVRLRSLAGFWRIDAVGIDWTPVEQLHPVEVRLLSATGPHDRDIREELGSPDAKYVIVTPGQRIDCRFGAVPPTPGRKTTYAIGVQGYMYEWLSGVPPEGARVITASMSGDMKITYIKTLFRMPGILLPPIYAEWKRIRG